MGQGTLPLFPAARGWWGLHMVASASQFTHVMCLITNSVIAHPPFPAARPALSWLLISGPPSVLRGRGPTLLPHALSILISLHTNRPSVPHSCHSSIFLLAWQPHNETSPTYPSGLNDRPSRTFPNTTDLRTAALFWALMLSHHLAKKETSAQRKRRRGSSCSLDTMLLRMCWVCSV